MMPKTPKSMRALVLHGHGGLDQLVLHDDWPVPEISAHEVLINVHACGLNNTDVNTRTGWYSKSVSENTTGSAFENANDKDASWGGIPITFPRIQGADVCGTVVDVGKGVDTCLIGKRVMVDTWVRDWNEPENLNKCGYLGSEFDGGYAEYTKVDYRNVHCVESTLSDVEIATFATSYVTAENMLDRANVGEGDSVLIPGASGGVGSALVQLVKRRGATAIAMAGRGKHNQLAKVRPDAMIDRNPADLATVLEEATGSDTVSVVADVVGGEQFASYLAVLERGGRYTCSGAIAGPIVDLDLRTLYLKDLTFTGATIVPAGTFARLVKYIENGEIQPLVAAEFKLENFPDAQHMFIRKNHVGNIVVTL